MVAPEGGFDLVAATEHVLTHEMRLNERIGRFGEVAVLRTAHEARIALGVEPPGDGLPASPPEAGGPLGAAAGAEDSAATGEASLMGGIEAPSLAASALSGRRRRGGRLGRGAGASVAAATLLSSGPSRYGLGSPPTSGACGSRDRGRRPRRLGRFGSFMLYCVWRGGPA
jgi:hypothetical protein